MTKRKTNKRDLPEGAKALVRNKKVFHDYNVEDTYEAGISLLGSEVKSLRESRATLVDGYVDLRNGEAWLVGVQINEYPWANQFNHEPTRRRKLLLHKAEIRKLQTKVAVRGYALVPLAFYLRNGKIKVQLGLGTGKRLFEKREAKKEADDRREMDRATRRHR